MFISINSHIKTRVPDFWSLWTYHINLLHFYINSVNNSYHKLNIITFFFTIFDWKSLFCQLQGIYRLKLPSSQIFPSYTRINFYNFFGMNLFKLVAWIVPKSTDVTGILFNPYFSLSYASWLLDMNREILKLSWNKIKLSWKTIYYSAFYY